MATGHLTNTGSNIYLNHLFRGQQKNTATPYLAPFLTMPSKQGPGSEPTGATRVMMTAQDWQAPVGGSTTTIKNLVFPRSTGGTVILSLSEFLTALAVAVVLLISSQMMGN